MAIRSSLSIMGLYIYDDSIFSLMELPEGIEADTVESAILMECADLELWLPDWDVMHDAIQIWSKKNLWKWAKMYASTQFEYNPIWNKDGEITDKIISNENGGGSNTGTVTSENSVSGYNVNQYSPESKNVTTPNTAWTDTRSRGESRTRKEQGNIGVTSTQQLIKEEREVSDFSIYDMIVRDFKEAFCLLVY